MIETGPASTTVCMSNIDPYQTIQNSCNDSAFSHRLLQNICRIVSGCKM